MEPLGCGPMWVRLWVARPVKRTHRARARGTLVLRLGLRGRDEAVLTPPPPLWASGREALSESQALPLPPLPPFPRAERRSTPLPPFSARPRLDLRRGRWEGGRGDGPTSGPLPPLFGRCGGLFDAARFQACFTPRTQWRQHAPTDTTHTHTLEAGAARTVRMNMCAGAPGARWRRMPRWRRPAMQEAYAALEAYTTL